MDTDYWASVDQYTSFAKEPWGFDRPENRKEHSFLSKATFLEWPNTTSDFSLHRGKAPSGKLVSHRKSPFVNEPVNNMVSEPSSSASKSITSKTSSCAISDEELRATVSTNKRNIGRPETGFVKNTAREKSAVPSGQQNNRAPTRSSADNVTAAYTLLDQVEARRNWSSGRKGGTSSPNTIGAVPHDWRVTNIGFNDIKSKARARIERDNQDGYKRAAFASRDADKPYVAEVVNFRFRYPHTLGRIATLSRVRGDRVGDRHG